MVSHAYLTPNIVLLSSASAFEEMNPFWGPSTKAQATMINWKGKFPYELLHASLLYDLPKLLLRENMPRGVVRLDARSTSSVVLACFVLEKLVDDQMPPL